MNYGAELKTTNLVTPVQDCRRPHPTSALGVFMILYFNWDGAEGEYAPLPDVYLVLRTVHLLSLPWDVIQEPVCACVSLGGRTMPFSLPAAQLPRTRGGLPLGLMVHWSFQGSPRILPRPLAGTSEATTSCQPLAHHPPLLPRGLRRSRPEMSQGLCCTSA